MIAGVRGTIAALEPQAVIVDLHGFLVRVLTSGTVATSAGAVGDPVELRTHLFVREDALTLYGFPTVEELDLFQLLLTVNGVGPRVALNLLSFTDTGTLYQAIQNEDAALLSKVPGIGKTTAARIVFDLRRKLPEYIPTPGGGIDTSDRDAIAALESLGYAPLEARNALNELEGRAGMSVEERVFAALQRLAGR